MNDKLAQALDHISDRKIAEAAVARKRHRHLLLKIVAAIVVVVLALNFNLPNIPMFITARAVSTASGSRQPERPYREDYDSYDDFRVVYDEYMALANEQDAQAASAIENLNAFFTAITAGYAAMDPDGNRVFSPVNAYIALATLAEVTDGDSRQQILTSLNTPDLDTLRRQVGAVWEQVYRDNGNEMSVLANSLWLNDNLSYEQQAMDDLAYYYYTSVYQKDLSARGAGRALQTWVSNNTGGLLKSNTSGMEFPEDAVLTLASTVYLQSKWSDQFSPTRNTSGTFHAPSGDREVTFMNRQDEADYYWAEDYGAARLWLKNNCCMWVFLPDEDKTVEDVLADGTYLETLIPNGPQEENSKYLKINWSLPKFDAASAGDLSAVLQDMGITDVFDLKASDFTAITSDSPVFLTGVNQAARVIVDEEGVKAASYIEIPGAGAAEPPEDEIDFVLDRPFVFVIAGTGGIPLFTGIVNEP